MHVPAVGRWPVVRCAEVVLDVAASHKQLIIVPVAALRLRSLEFRKDLTKHIALPYGRKRLPEKGRAISVLSKIILGPGSCGYTVDSGNPSGLGR